MAVTYDGDSSDEEYSASEASELSSSNFAEKIEIRPREAIDFRARGLDLTAFFDNSLNTFSGGVQITCMLSSWKSGWLFDTTAS